MTAMKTITVEVEPADTDAYGMNAWTVVSGAIDEAKAAMSVETIPATALPLYGAEALAAMLNLARNHPDHRIAKLRKIGRRERTGAIIYRAELRLILRG